MDPVTIAEMLLNTPRPSHGCRSASKHTETQWLERQKAVTICMLWASTCTEPEQCLWKQRILCIYVQCCGRVSVVQDELVGAAKHPLQLWTVSFALTLVSCQRAGSVYTTKAMFDKT